MKNKIKNYKMKTRFQENSGSVNADKIFFHQFNLFTNCQSRYFIANP